MAAAMGAAAWGDIIVELRPVNDTVTLGDVAEIGVWFVSDDPTTQHASAADVILTWDTTYLSLAGNDDTGAYGLLSSGFPAAHLSGLNQTFADGDALYVAFANFGDTIPASPSGVLATTLLFDTLALTAGTDIDIPLTLGTGETAVFDATAPNVNVVGSTVGATISIVPIPGPGGLLVLAGGAVLMSKQRRRASFAR